MNWRLHELTFPAILLFVLILGQNSLAQTLSLDEVKARACTSPLDSGRAWCRKRIDDLDRKLNLVYQETAQAVSNPQDLRSQQRKWLVTVRDACASEDCAVKALVERVLVLQETAVRALGRRELPMTSQEQREICEGIADLSSRGELADRLISPEDMPRRKLNAAETAAAEERRTSNYSGLTGYFALPVRSGQEFVFSNVFSGGTCSSWGIRGVSAPLLRPDEEWPSEEIDDDEHDDTIRWATWGGGEAILVFRGRNFFVTTQGPDGAAGIVTWVTPIGTRRPICSLGVERKERSITFVREDETLCNAALQQELPALDWRDTASPEFTEAENNRFLIDHGLRGAGMPGLVHLRADIDNDGKPELLARGQYDSGAGCGATMSKPFLVSADGKRVQPGPMNDALAELATTNGEGFEVYSHRGMQYLYGALRDQPALFKFSSGVAAAECIFHDQPISRVRKLYPLDGAVRDPDKVRD